ncbi:unnamed protein product [Paramecium primaurelia]|uniref:Transmembrane protein n=1 Tax=Paramecium primaurelia TaxID=5886 RepID=A0A8S1PJI8_PARPR|nr:unnamed protein product [Paramecium primaurelia]
MENIHQQKTQIEPQTNQCIYQVDKKSHSGQESQFISNKDFLSVTIIENKDPVKQIPIGKPTYFETQSQKELKSLKLCYGIFSLFIVGFILARILPQFLFDGCRVSACVWIISITLYVSNIIYFNLLISNKMLYTITVWMIINCLTFLADLIATLLAFQAPLYYNECKTQDQMSTSNDCQQKRDLKNAFSIMNVLFLLIIGVTHGCYCYKGYQIRKLIISQQRLANKVPVSEQIEF